MENMVENVANETMIQQADAAESFVDASELMVEPQVETVEETQPAGTPQADVAEKTYTKAELDAEIRKKAEFISKGTEKKYQTDPYYLLGKTLAELTGEKDPMKAVEKVRQDNLQRQAEALAQDPTVLAQMLLEMRAPRVEQDADVKKLAGRITEDLLDAIANEELPDDFDPIEFDRKHPGFFDHAAKRGVSAAYNRFSKQKENDPLTAKLAQAHALPKPTRPSTPVPEQKRDYMAMSDKEFREMDARIKAAAAQGRKVIL